MSIKPLLTFEEVLKSLSLKTVSFHHHLRNGDQTLNQSVSAIRRAGLRDLTLLPSSLFPVHAPLVEAFHDGTVTGLRTNYMSGPVADAISHGALATPVLLQSHGGRARAITDGEVEIDLALIAAPACDRHGNATGAFGPSACGPLGYGMVDAAHAKTVVLVTDNLLDTLPGPADIPGHQVDAIIQVPSLGDPGGLRAQLEIKLSDFSRL
jgi:citrate lyase subunit alpha/citrate CoA-transferase